MKLKAVIYLTTPADQVIELEHIASYPNAQRFIATCLKTIEQWRGENKLSHYYIYVYTDGGWQIYVSRKDKARLAADRARLHNDILNAYASWTDDMVERSLPWHRNKECGCTLDQHCNQAKYELGVVAKHRKLRIAADDDASAE